MTEIEPMYYMGNSNMGHIFSGSKTDNCKIPLYTKEQLQQRVKMTKRQYDRLMWDKENNTLSICLEYFYEHNGKYRFGKPVENLMGDLTQEDIARAWVYPDCIEIIADKKWFVRSKEADEDGDWLFLSNISKDKFNDRYCYSRDKKGVLSINSHAFDTKEEAEEWTNPLTEAVLLPVEGEK